jgi:hypothetical protein
MPQCEFKKYWPKTTAYPQLNRFLTGKLQKFAPRFLKIRSSLILEEKFLIHRGANG